MERKNKQIIVLAIVFILLFKTNCVGPKFLAKNEGSFQNWSKVPLNLKEVSIRLFHDELGEDIEGRLFVEVLANKIKEHQLFQKVNIISRDEIPQTDLVIEGEVVIERKAGWALRSELGIVSAFGVSGRIINVKKDKILLTFNNTRSGEGGVFGITAGKEQEFYPKLIEWAAEDIVRMIIKSIYGEKYETKK